MTLRESTILVVDDEPVLRLTFSALLKQAGAVVHVAADGMDALNVAEQHTFHAILTDKQMPEMDGLTLLYHLRQRGIAAPAIFFVNGIGSEDQSEMDRLGVVQTVTKPLHPKELLQVLGAALAPLPSRS